MTARAREKSRVLLLLLGPRVIVIVGELLRGFRCTDFSWDCGGGGGVQFELKE